MVSKHGVATTEGQTTVSYTYLDSPVGELLVVGNEQGLIAIEFSADGERAALQPDWQQADEPFEEARRQLEAYFAGQLREFNLPLAPRGTPFQLATWRELWKIPYGETITYAELARRIGRPRAVRAVGAANGRNPLAIVVPCHRVIGSNGRLVGYGGGLDIKRKLLEIEGVLAR